MNPIERALADADKIIAANAELERISRELEIHPKGHHRPDDDGESCIDCGKEITWTGPSPRDWDLVEGQ